MHGRRKSVGDAGEMGADGGESKRRMGFAAPPQPSFPRTRESRDFGALPG
ncbi:hypothetical protein GLE_3123 [Lysobacter enzymogenes]|uniref:Uncharacterized protein n=1 Tax=Lysobacter enzymogenes TaxID=69 RepID=A0A0S2DIJ7_LYSEN|nr:hypothetical protein GLE_3123 [Lysobacter enzymogenes]